MGAEENITIKDNGILLRLRISPNASKNMMVRDGDIIKLKVTAQPIENKANKAVIEYLSKTFRIPKSSIDIVKGETSKDKTIFISITDNLKTDEIKNFISSI